MREQLFGITKKTRTFIKELPTAEEIVNQKITPNLTEQTTHKNLTQLTELSTKIVDNIIACAKRLAADAQKIALDAIKSISDLENKPPKHQTDKLHELKQTAANAVTLAEQASTLQLTILNTLPAKLMTLLNSTELDQKTKIAILTNTLTNTERLSSLPCHGLNDNVQTVIKNLNAT